MPIIELDVECPACDGTGLYVGMAERNGAAVVCSKCRGTGCFHYKYKYKSFKKRKARGGVKRVFLRAGGYVHSAEDVTTEENGPIEFSAAGVSYEDWLAGEHPKPVKELYCPLLWAAHALICGTAAEYYRAERNGECETIDDDYCRGTVPSTQPSRNSGACDRNRAIAVTRG